MTVFGTALFFRLWATTPHSTCHFCAFSNLFQYLLVCRLSCLFIPFPHSAGLWVAHARLTYLTSKCNSEWERPSDSIPLWPCVTHVVFVTCDPGGGQPEGVRDWAAEGGRGQAREGEGDPHQAHQAAGGGEGGAREEQGRAAV